MYGCSPARNPICQAARSAGSPGIHQGQTLGLLASQTCRFAGQALESDWRRAPVTLQQSWQMLMELKMSARTAEHCPYQEGVSFIMHPGAGLQRYGAGAGWHHCINDSSGSESSDLPGPRHERAPAYEDHFCKVPRACHKSTWQCDGPRTNNPLHHRGPCCPPVQGSLPLPRLTVAPSKTGNT